VEEDEIDLSKVSRNPFLGYPAERAEYHLRFCLAVIGSYFSAHITGDALYDSWNGYRHDDDALVQAVHSLKTMRVLIRRGPKTGSACWKFCSGSPCWRVFSLPVMSASVRGFSLDSRAQHLPRWVQSYLRSNMCIAPSRHRQAMDQIGLATATVQHRLQPGS